MYAYMQEIVDKIGTQTALLELVCEALEANVSRNDVTEEERCSSHSHVSASR